MVDQNEVLYTAEDMAQKYRYTVETIWRRCRLYQKGEKGGWPHRKDGRFVRFTQGDVDAIDELMNPDPVESTSGSSKRRPLAV